MDRIIVITAPEALEGEAETCVQLLQLGLQRLHLRKPGWPKEKLLQLAEAIPPPLRHRLVVHHHPEVAAAAGLGGLHLSYSRFAPPEDSGIPVSCSVHGWTEAEQVAPHCAYLFVSPVFDSLSKSGYGQNRALHRVPEPLKKHRLFALGGITGENWKQVLDMGYYGAALLGYIWNEPHKAVERLAKMMGS